MLITNDINFMRRKRRQLEGLQKFDKKLFYAGGVLFGISVFLTVGTGGYWQWSRLELASVEEQIDQQERVVRGAAEEEAKYLLYTTRLTAVQGVLEDRSPKKEALDFLAELLVPSIAFDAVNYDTYERRLTFRVEAQDVFSVEVFLNKLREPQMNEKIDQIQISSIQRDENGRYVMNVDIILLGSGE